MPGTNVRIYPTNEYEQGDSGSHEWDGYVKISLGWFSLESPLRKRLLRLCEPDSKFDSFILMMIVLNTIIMACVDYRYINENYEPVSDQSLRNYLVEKAEIFFMVFFVVECFVKVVAWGFMKGEKAYIRSAWNMFDFAIVLCSIISVIPIFPNISALRSLRVLRPLRSISKLPGLRKIVLALVDSIDDLCNVMFLLTFLILGFSIMGILFWNGILHARCRLTPYPIKMPEDCSATIDPCWDNYIQEAIQNPDMYRCLSDENDDPSWTQSTSPWFIKGPQNCVWPIDENDKRVCSLSSIGLHFCSPLYSSSMKDSINRTCGSNYDRFGNQRFLNDAIPYGYPRMNSGTFNEELNWGFTNFDSFFPAFITTFQIITLEGWTDIMNQVVDAWYFAPTVFIFCVQVILCGYIVLNLVLAVITNSLELIEDDYSTEICEADTIEPNNMEFNLSSRLISFLKGKSHSIFIMICIILNTIILCLDHYGISEDTSDVLEVLNTVFTIIFFIDVVLCNYAFGFKEYWSDSFMCFDGIIGIISAIELIIIYAFPNSTAGSSSFSIFRSLRLFRIFKMAKSWKSLNSLLRTMVSSAKEIGNFAILLLLFIFIYSLVGMQLLSNRLHFSTRNGDAVGINELEYNSAYIPRSHFDSFSWSIVTVFQILTGENWNAIMYDGWKSRGIIAVVYISSLLVIGVFIVMNLFLAILLKKFEDSGDFVDETKIFHRKTQFVKDDAAKSGKRPSIIQILWAKLGKNNVFRKLCFKIVESTRFEVCVTVLIIGSSLCLVLDGPLLDPDSVKARVLYAFDIVFTILFCLEMVIKVLAYGLIVESGSYLRNSWNILDFVALLVSVLNLAEIGPGSSLRALRTLRVLRPLRMVNKFPGLKVVVDALLLSFPSVADVAVLCTLFFIIFASFGVNFLKGTFYHCRGEAFNNLTTEQIEYLTYPITWGEIDVDKLSWFDVPVDGCEASSWSSSTVPTSKDICDCLAPGEWKPAIPQNFDNVANGMSLLFEIATTEGWVDVMYAAIDQRGIGMQPVRDSNPYWSIFFILFLVVGAFFVLELFVGVIIENFNKIKEQNGRGMMTEAQKVWAATQSFVMKIKPEKRTTKPSGRIQSWCYDFIMPHSNPRFQDFITFCILASSVLTAMVSFGDSDVKSTVFEVCNFILSGIFTIEVVLKLFALQRRYFDDSWNKFDFVVVCGSNLFIVVGIFFTKTGPLSSLIRFLRVCRLFRLIKRVKKLRLLFNTLIVSIPSIVNIGSLLLLLFFIYAAIGIQLFSFIPNNDMVSEHANFRSFGSAMFLLLRFSTGENWNGYMHSIIGSKENCDKNPRYDVASPWCLSENENPNECTAINGCGAGLIAYVYFYTFTLLVSFVILNLFVGIVLEAFENSNEGDILLPKDMDHFTKCWSEIDPLATWHIKAIDMKRLLVKLGAPLGVERRDLAELERIMNDECLRELPVNHKGEVNIVHVATQLAKRLAKIKQGDEFHELADDHPVQVKIDGTKSEVDKTLDELLVERSKKKVRILRALVRAHVKSEAKATRETNSI